MIKRFHFSIICALLCFVILCLYAQDRDFNSPSQVTGSRVGEFLIDTNVVYVPASYSEYSPSTASGNSNTFVVWYGRRTGTAFDIFAARVDNSGNILDPAGIFIARAEYDPNPAVAFDGTNYLVVWHDRPGGGTYDIYGMRINTNGNLLDSEPIEICTAVGNQQSPAVSFDGTNYLVVWHDSRSGTSNDIYGTRVNQSGTVLNPAGIAICTAAENQYFPSISFDGTNFLVAWQDERSGSFYDIYGSRVDQSGIVLDPAGISISTAADDQSRPTIAFADTNYLVVWYDKRGGSNYDIYGTRVNQSGTVLNPAGIAICTAADDQYYPSISFNDTNFLVAWYDRRSGSNYDIYGARVAQSGVVLEPAGIQISTASNNQVTPSLAFNGTHWLAVWRDERSGLYSDIYGSRVDETGSVLDPSGFLISTSAQLQEYPAIAFDGTNYLVVWQEDRSGGAYDIYGTRVDQNGNMLDPSAIAISTSAGSQEEPAVAFDGTNYLVAWHDNRSGTYDIYGARVATNGTVLDPPGIAISTAVQRQRYPSIAFDGTNYLVVWEDERFGVGAIDIYGSRVAQNGSVLDPSGIIISNATYGQWDPAVTFGGSNYFVVWGDYGSGTFEEDIYGARVATNGTVLDPSGIAITTAANGQWYPVVAFDGTNYFAVWFDRRTSNASDIYGTRVAQNGTVLDPSGILISDASGTQSYPAITFDNTNYFIVWEDTRNDTAVDIYGAKVNTSGTIVENFYVTLQSVNTPFPKPALAKGLTDQLLVTFSGWAKYVNGHPANTRRIWGRFYPFVSIEENVSGPSPNALHMLDIYPNIVHDECNIVYNLPHKTSVCISLYDVTGRLIKELINENLDAGIYKKRFETAGLTRGVYFIRLNTEDYSEVEKVIMVR